MKYLIFIMALLLCSCSTIQMQQWHCSKCPTKDSTYIKVVEKDSVVQRDSMVLVPKVVLNIKDSVPCKDFKYEKKDIRASFKIQVKDSVMEAECICEGLEIKLRWYEHHYSKLLTSHQTFTRVSYITAPKTGFQRFKDWWFWICVSMLAILIARFILKKAGRWPLPI